MSTLLESAWRNLSFRTIKFKKNNKKPKKPIKNRFFRTCFLYFEKNRFFTSLGVIQGSKTGPLLYDIYSNDINHLCGDRENILFADDTCLTYVGDDLSSLAEHVNERLALIADWCRSNKLSINPTKSEYTGCFLNYACNFNHV